MRTNSRRRRRKSRNGSKTFIGIVLVTAAVVVLVGIYEGAVKTDGKNQITPTAAVSQQEPGEDRLLTAAPEITVFGIPVTGLSREEAVKQIEHAYPWNIKIKNGDAEEAAADWMKPQLDEILNQVYSGSEVKSYEPDYDKIEAEIRKQAEALAGEWNTEPVDSQLEAFDKKSKTFSYTKEQAGRALDQEQLAEDVMRAVKNKDFNASIEAKFAVLEPKRTQAQAKEQYRVIGSFSTKTTNNANRNKNISLAVETIDGKVLKPGEEFSFNNTTGNRTKEKGYQPAGAYKNGILIEEPGGGVCQVSTTLYNALVSSGFDATERHFHSFTPSYIPPGQDAMVSFDGYSGPDLKFVNTEAVNVAIRASFQDNNLKISIVGLPILEDGVKITLRSEKARDTEPPQTEYVENPNLPFGTEQEVVKPEHGAVWKTYRVVSKGDQVLEEDYLHSSTYKGKGSTIQRNTLVDNTQPETEAVSEPESEAPEVPESQSAEMTEEEIQKPSDEVQFTGPGMAPSEETAPTQGE